MFSTSLLLLLAAASCVHCEELTQPGSMVVRPDQSLTIDCKVSYSVTSYYTGWIRQPAGKALEWIGYIHSGGSVYYSDKLKSKFSISRNTGTNTVTLQGHNLQTEDTAVYYCSTGSYFDYWGKGTSVTVSSVSTAPPSAPVVVSECAPTSGDGFLTLGCVASDFFPSSISFSWTDGSGRAVSDMVQYPAMEPESNKFTAVSHVRIKPEKGKATTLTCQVNHLNKNQSASATVQVPTPPTVHLGEIGQSIACIIEDFHPDAVNVKWKKDNQEVQGKDWIAKGKSSGLNKAVSVLETNQTSPGTKYTCEVTHGGKRFTNELTSTAHFSVKISPPQAKELFLNSTAVIDCVISGNDRKEVEGAKVSWTVGGRTQTSNITDGGVTQTGSSFTKTSTLTIPESVWFSGDEVMCSASSGKKTTSEKISVRKGSKQPSVTIYKPEKSVSDSDMVSLVCEVSSSNFGDVYIMWQENHGQYMEGNGMTMMKKDSTLIVLSSLIVSGQKYNDQSQSFTCAVKDAYMETDNLPRQITTSKSKDTCPPCPVSDCR